MSAGVAKRPSIAMTPRPSLADAAAEVQVGREWAPVTLEEVQTLAKGRNMRCPECGEPNRFHREGVNGQAAHMEHHERNPDCSRSHRER